MDQYFWIITITVISMVPVISFSYVFLRLAQRIDLLKDLFTLPGIYNAYLSSKGVETGVLPDESPEKRANRLEREFNRIFKTETSREYGYGRYVIAILIGSISSGIIIYLLAVHLLTTIPDGTSAPSGVNPLEFALLGAYVWTVWVLLTGYEALDLTPSTFYWIPFRFLVAVIAGLLSTVIFNERIAPMFAVLSTAIPYPELMNYFRNRIPQMEHAVSGDPPLRKIQGMHESTIYTLQRLGISTTQELAYVDPLRLLFRTNFPPKVVIDWMDQALLYNYVGDHIERLRPRGVRGAIELLVTNEDTDLSSDLAKILDITELEYEHLTSMLGFDYQVQLVAQIWEEFRIRSLAESVEEAADSAALPPATT